MGRPESEALGTTTGWCERGRTSAASKGRDGRSPARHLLLARRHDARAGGGAPLGAVVGWAGGSKTSVSGRCGVCGAREHRLYSRTTRAPQARVAGRGPWGFMQGP